MPRKTSPTLEECVDKYQRARSISKETATVANDGYVLRALMAAMGATTQVHKVTEDDMETYMTGERQRLNENSFNKYRSRLSMFFAFCIRKGWMTANPMDFIERVGVPEREWMQLSREDLSALPTYARTARDKALLIVACNTGLRASEFLALKVGDVDFEQKRISVTIKKSKSFDRMPMTVELIEGLSEWFKAYEADAGPLQGEWFLFPGAKRGAGLRRESGQFVNGSPVQTVGQYLPEVPMSHPVLVVQRAMTDAGYFWKKGEGCHTLRRSAARVFYDWRVQELGGHDSALRQTSSFLHHKTTAITESYLSLSKERLDRDAALEGKSFLGAPAAEITPLRAVGGA